MSAIVMVLGSVLFLTAAFMPISNRVYPETSSARRLEHITAAPTAWVVSQVLFGLGAIVTAVGIALLATHLRADPSSWLLWASTAVLALGVLPWLVHLYARATDPAAFTQGALPSWTSLLYFALTEVGLAILGAALVFSPYPAWLGWVVIVSAALLVVLTIVFGDMPPLFFYVPTLLVGVVVLVASPSGVGS